MRAKTAALGDRRAVTAGSSQRGTLCLLLLLLLLLRTQHWSRSRCSRAAAASPSTLPSPYSSYCTGRQGRRGGRTEPAV